ncbi:hypothetical protein GcM3_013012 [Golovinomyces cichoracearum]|uniref:Uncharacterized protein n=1 Tax=Golovinomyces cichoracearum TaxID=62708 RepID=A0A420J9A4_9PEZI|nr:hypothetical protein GcM3_013012 [Golovinomyces cichoracearum]
MAVNSLKYSERVFGADQNKFKSLNWNPENPLITSLHQSLEPVSIQSQRVAYTTVGSLVNPKNILQFTAPNRIQREGANRRPLMSILANQSLDSVFQSCDPVPPLDMSNSVQYKNQLPRSASNLELNPTSIPEVKPSPDFLAVTEPEDNILRAELNEILPTYPQNEKIFNLLPQSSDLHRHSIEERVSKEFGRKTTEPVVKLKTRFQGFEKMQTLQRLSKFNNPIQEWARNKLSEFAVAKQKNPQKTSISPSHGESFLLGHSQPYEETVEASDSEEIDLDYRDLFNNNSLNTEPSEIHRTDSITPQNSITTRLSSYPEPLTAGPPGQRNSDLSFNQPCRNHQNQFLGQYKAINYESQMSHQMNGSQVVGVTCRQEYVMPWAGHTSSHLVDTISLENAARYYPYALPTGATEMREFHDSLNLGLVDSRKSDQHHKTLNNWFYYGQRRFAMTATQEFSQDSNGQYSKSNNLGHVYLSKYIPPEDQLSKFSVAEMNQMSLPECTAPMVKSLLVNLIEYSDMETPGSRAALSNFIEAPLKSIDNSGKRNSTFLDDFK